VTVSTLTGFDPSRVERVARAIAAGKRDPRTPPEEIDRVWTAYCGQARAALAADDSELAKENADLIHDLERQMTIANIECNRAEDYRDLLETALPYVESMASAQSMADGFGEKRARKSDADARAIQIALGSDLPCATKARVSLFSAKLSSTLRHKPKPRWR
jgi:hypothetical protein